MQRTARHAAQWMAAALLALAVATTGARAHEDLVVMIECTLDDGRVSQGSGVLVSAQGHVLTARHVAPDSATCTGRIGNRTRKERGMIWPVEDRALAPEIDARLLSFAPDAGEVFTYARYCTVAGQPISTGLTARGFHRDSVSLPSATTGVLSSITMNYDGFVETDVMVGPGKSGGPVFLRDTRHIVGIVAGAKFDSSGIITNYAMLAVDALLGGFTLLEEVPECSPQIAATSDTFKPTIDYFNGVLESVRRTPETSRKMFTETIAAHKTFFSDLSDTTADDAEAAKAVAAVRDALLTSPIDPQDVRDRLLQAVTTQSNADLLSGAGRTTAHAHLLRLQADFEAARLNRAEAARLYRVAVAAYPPSEQDAIREALFRAGQQLYLLARDTSDTASLAQGISVLEQARDALRPDLPAEVRALTQLKLGDAYRRQAKRECGTGSFDLAKAAYETGLQSIDRDTEPLLWAELSVHLGAAIAGVADRVKSDVLLEQSIALYEDALPVLDRSVAEQASELKAEALDNLGEALGRRGAQAADTVDLEAAYDAFERAISIRSRATLPYDWSATRSNQGNVLAELGRRKTRGDDLDRALRAYAEALEVRGRDTVPLRWAETQHSLARTLLFAGSRDRSAAKIRQAIDLLEAALKVRTIDTTPIEWAQSQVTLGTAYFTLGDITFDERALEQAKSAFEQALFTRFSENRTFRECHPLRWAAATNNLGNVLLRLGQSKADATYLDQALDAYKMAGEEWRQDKEPLEWARAQHNIGTVTFGIGQHEGSAELIDQAAVALTAALGVRDAAKASAEWIETAVNLGATHLWKGRHFSDTAELERAYGMFTDVVALSGENAAIAGMANFFAGAAGVALFEITGTQSNRLDAIERLKMAEGYYQSVGDQVQAAQIRTSIDQLSQ